MPVVLLGDCVNQCTPPTAPEQLTRVSAELLAGRCIHRGVVCLSVTCTVQRFLLSRA